MSGLVKGVKKVFKKVGKFVKKNWKWIALAVAVYFTAGIALSYFGSTAAFSAAMPGFGAGGMFAKTAVWMGFSGGVGSGIAATAAAAAPAVAGTALAASGEFVAPLAANIGTPIAASSVVPTASSLSPLIAPAGGAAAGGAAITPLAANAGKAALTTNDILAKALTTQSRLAIAKMGMDIVAGLTEKDEYETWKKMHEDSYASSFGVDREGNKAFGWGTQGSGNAFSQMNKGQGSGSSVGYGQQSGQSQFRDTQFLATPFESSNPNRMPSGGGDFIQQGYQEKNYG